jgi:hypothetical protein
MYYILALLRDGSGEEVWTYSDGQITLGDVITPAAIGDPVAIDPGFGDGLNLTWTAPGDDGDVGMAVAYEIRYDTQNINSETRWDQATEYPQDIVPKEPGSDEWLHVTNPGNASVYHYAIRAIDDEDNLGPIVSMSNSTVLFLNDWAFDLDNGFNVSIDWHGYANIFGEEYEFSGNPPAGHLSLGDTYFELDQDGEVRNIEIRIRYPQNFDQLGIEQVKVYRLVGGTGWELIPDSGVWTNIFTIFASPDHLSIFAPFVLEPDEPELTQFQWQPVAPTEDDKITFTVVFNYDLDVAPVYVQLWAGGQRFDMELVGGVPTNGSIYSATIKLPKGVHEILVKAGGEFGETDEITSIITSIEVGEGEEDKAEPPIMLFAGIAVVIILVILLMAVSARKRKRAAAEVAKESGSTVPIEPADMVEAEVYEVPFEEEKPPAFTESEATPVEVGTEAVPAEGAVPIGTAAPPADTAEQTPVPEPIDMAAPLVPPPRLTLPTVPPDRPAVPDKEKPKAIEAEVMDIGKIMVAPCPSCGHNLIIPKDRPVDIKCPGCEDEFTIQ